MSLSGLELRRFARAGLTRLAVAALVMLPLLYAGLYLWSFWDPYGKISRLPVALVVDDRPATAGGKTVHAGQDLADELKRRKVFDWHQVDDRTAADGVANGRYYMSLTIPADFSAGLASPQDLEDAPRPAALQVHLNDANSYIASTIANAAFNEIKAAAAAGAVHDYFDQIFVSFGQLHDKLQQAAEGADKLAKGIDQAENGAARLRQGIGTAKDGADRLVGGLATAKSGADQLVAGLAKLNSGAAELQSGSAQVAAGTQRLTTMFDQVTDKLLPFLDGHPNDIGNTALLVAHGADAAATALDALPNQTAQAVRQATAARRTICALAATHPEAAPACSAATTVLSTARQVNAQVRAHTGELRRVAAQARQLARDARRLAADAPHLAGDVRQARRDVHRLNSGAHQVAAGLVTLHQGIGTAYSGEVRLSKGLAALQSGAARLDSGLGRLYTGARQLESGLNQASTGAHRLAKGLHEGTGQVPDYTKDQRNQRSGVMSDPVRLATATSNPAPDYGTGFAPFFVPLALWVGAMFVYMVLRPLNPRALAAAAPARRVAFAGWFPAVLVGILQVAVLLLVLKFALGLTAVRWAGLIALLVLTAGSFMAVVQFVYGRFGPVGRVIALVLLMLQLTSSAGTYPIQTSPRFFQVLHPILPMGWVVTALRHLISGGPLTSVWECCAVLLAYLAGGLGLTMLTVRRERVWTLKRLHPVLKL
ncbi:YhgE/Pip domain-containing protein [Actinoallomurus soli]|uniref:YhgE/Pip domain-containing protein n=1 Tax=Actinoallomurus soli TaxID=2952535 RepID=UPI002092AA34|nr:YhgE/Pip domain-containing protein [Actinoallomurus soli]MCO5975022.1 YhgE/Pip domain-containing protein [Actinoallomurus soli]